MGFARWVRIRGAGGRWCVIGGVIGFGSGDDGKRVGDKGRNRVCASGKGRDSKRKSTYDQDIKSVK